MTELGARLAAIPTGTVKGILRKRGLVRVAMRGLVPISSKERVAGPARTLRYLPLREDVEPWPRGRLNRTLIEQLSRGEVIVMDALKVTDASVMGDVLATGVQVRGGAAIVIDGVTRDADGLRALGLPVYARGTHPDPGSEALWPWEADVAIQCGGVYVEPGDYIVADADAVIVVPKAIAGDVAGQAEEIALEEEFAVGLIREGAQLSAVYPLPASLRPEFEKFKRRCSAKEQA